MLYRHADPYIFNLITAQMLLHTEEIWTVGQHFADTAPAPLTMEYVFGLYRRYKTSCAVATFNINLHSSIPAAVKAKRETRYLCMLTHYFEAFRNELVKYIDDADEEGNYEGPGQAPFSRVALTVLAQYKPQQLDLLFGCFGRLIQDLSCALQLDLGPDPSSVVSEEDLCQLLILGGMEAFQYGYIPSFSDMRNAFMKAHLIHANAWDPRRTMPTFVPQLRAPIMAPLQIAETRKVQDLLPSWTELLMFPDSLLEWLELPVPPGGREGAMERYTAYLESADDVEEA